MDCLFCKIIAGEIPCEKVFENEFVLAFKDINPQCKTHALVIPKIHMQNLNSIDGFTSVYALKCLEAIPKIAMILNVADSGYRVISNCGKDAAQSVMHLHFHLLGGEQLNEKIV